MVVMKRLTTHPRWVVTMISVMMLTKMSLKRYGFISVFHQLMLKVKSFSFGISACHVFPSNRVKSNVICRVFE